MTEPRGADHAVSYAIEFQPLGRRGRCGPADSILDCAQRLGIGINSVCGGKGTCFSCRVRITRGTAPELTPAEKGAFSPREIQEGWRLACQVHPVSDCSIFIPVESMTTRQRTQIEGLPAKPELEPAVKIYDLELQAPTLDALRADAEILVKDLNLKHNLDCDRVDVAVLRNIDRLRALDWRCRAAVRQREVISLGSPDTKPLGLAVDLGSTKIAAYLADLTSGDILCAAGMMNPQISLGEDIITRMTKALESPENAARLRTLVVDGLNELAAELCRKANAGVEEIVDSVVVGNTAMHHFFLGLPLRQLALSPYVPAVSQALDIRARDAGLRLAPGAYVHLLPNVAGFVGADHVADLLATEPWHDKGLVLIVDIGTNTEVSLIKDGAISSASCASGPAFEGGHIKDGMRAAGGAIERLQIENGVIHYQTIDNEPPIGICGSGIIDAVAQLYLNGIIDHTGRFREVHPNVRSVQNTREFVLVNEAKRDGRRPIVITQRDIRELQKAKAAIRSGIQVLLETNKCAEDEIDQVIIAGAFGSYIDISSALTLAMLPTLPLERFRQVGNAAGSGACLALLSLKERDKAREIASRIRYIELARHHGFMNIYLEANYLGRFRIVAGKRVEMAR